MTSSGEPRERDVGRTLLVICHDLLSATFDRRISQTIETWLSQGWSVTCIACRAEAEPDPPRIPGIDWRVVDYRTMRVIFDPIWSAMIDFSHRSQAAEAAIPGAVAQIEVEAPVAASPTLALWDPIRRGVRWAKSSALLRRLWQSVPSQIRVSALGLAAKYGAFGRTSPSPIAEPERKPVDTPPIPWYPLAFTDAFLEAAAGIKCDAILACDLVTIPAALAISQRNDAVLVYDMHEYYLEQIAFDPLQKKLLEHWEEIGLAQALISYTVSQPIASAMQERYRLLSAPGVITNALKVPAGLISVKQEDRLRVAVGAREGDKVLLYHGGFVINRNLEKLIEGFGLSSREDVVLVLMGYGDLSFAQDALTAAAATSRIVVLPAVPAVELSEWVVGADAVVIPYPSVDLNTTLCAPNKLFDCIALGVPLLVNQELENVGAILEEFGIGSRIDLTSSSSVSCAISAWKGEPIALSRFEAAQIQLGWEAQEQKLLGWIHAVEEEVERRRSRSEALVGEHAYACVAAQ